MKHKIIATLLYLSSASFMWAQASAMDAGDGLRNGSASIALENSTHQYARWSGIGLLRTAQGTCNATLIDTRGDSSRSSGPAYLITSGHCVAHEIGTSKLDYTFDANVTFNYFHDTPEHHKTYKVRTANWTSMVGTDLAVIELEAPLSQLIQDTISPLKLSSAPPLGAHDVLNVGSPGGFSMGGLRLSACSQEVSRTLSGLPPASPGGLINQCQDLAHGSSGSPMLDRRTNKIISIISENNYSFSPHFLSSCFTNGIFTNNSQSCMLKPVDIAVEFTSLFKTKMRSHSSATGEEILPDWDYKFTIDTPYYRYKSVRDALSCQDPGHYSFAISAIAPHITTSISAESRMHVLCIIGVKSTDQKLSSAFLRNAFTHAVHLAEPAPRPTITQSTDDKMDITWANSYPEFTTHYFYAAPAGTTQCGGILDDRYKKAAQIETLNVASPMKICSYASNDTDLQPSAVRTDFVGPSLRWTP